MAKSISPDIIYIQKYHQYFDTNFKNTREYNRDPEAYDKLIKKSSFYRSPTAQNSLTSYLTRNGACDKTPLYTTETNEEVALLSEIGVKESSIIDYMKDRKGSTGLFNANGDISKPQLKALRRELSECKTNIYEGVLSFSSDVSDKAISDKSEAYELLKNIMPKYFLDKGLDPENMTWFAAYHLNPAHSHCHIIFFEKEPSRYQQNGKPANIEFTKADLHHFKELVAFARPMDRSYVMMRDPILESVKEDAKYAPYKDMLQNVRRVCENKNQFARCNEEERKAIREYQKFIYETSPNYRTNYDNMMKALDNKQKEILSIYESNHIKPTPYALNFAASRKEELNDRVANLILKTAKNTPLLNVNYRKDKLSSFTSRVGKDTSMIRWNAIMNRTIERAYRNNPIRKAEVMASSQSSKVNLFSLLDSYHNVINSERIWKELEEDRRLKEILAAKEQAQGQEREGR